MARINKNRKLNILEAHWQRETGISNTQNIKQELLATAEDRLVYKEHDELTCEMPGMPRSTFLMVFSPDGTKVASTHGNHNVYVTDLRTGKNCNTLVGHPRTPWCIAFHPSSNQILATGCLGGQVRIWDLSGGSAVWTTDCQTVIASLAFHPHDRLLVIATYNVLFFWDWSQPKPFMQTCTNNVKEKVRYVAFDRLGHKLITGIANMQANGPRSWERTRGSHPHSFFTQSTPITRIPQPDFYFIRHNNSVYTHRGNRAPRPSTNQPGSSGRQTHANSASVEATGEDESENSNSEYESRIIQLYESLMQRFLEVHRPRSTSSIDRGTDPMDPIPLNSALSSQTSTTNTDPITTSVPIHLSTDANSNQPTTQTPETKNNAIPINEIVPLAGPSGIQICKKRPRKRPPKRNKRTLMQALQSDEDEDSSSSTSSDDSGERCLKRRLKLVAPHKVKNSMTALDHQEPSTSNSRMKSKKTNNFFFLIPKKSRKERSKPKHKKSQAVKDRKNKFSVSEGSAFHPTESFVSPNNDSTKNVERPEVIASGPGESSSTTVPDLPETSFSAAVPEASSSTALPDAPEASSSTEMPDIPEAFSSTTVSDVPEASLLTAAPDVPEVSFQLEVPQTHVETTNSSADLSTNSDGSSMEVESHIPVPRRSQSEIDTGQWRSNNTNPSPTPSQPFRPPRPQSQPIQSTSSTNQPNNQSRGRNSDASPQSPDANLDDGPVDLSSGGYSVDDNSTSRVIPPVDPTVDHNYMAASTSSSDGTPPHGIDPNLYASARPRHRHLVVHPDDFARAEMRQLQFIKHMCHKFQDLLFANSGDADTQSRRSTEEASTSSAQTAQNTQEVSENQNASSSTSSPRRRNSYPRSMTFRPYNPRAPSHSEPSTSGHSSPPISSNSVDSQTQSTDLNRAVNSSIQSSQSTSSTSMNNRFSTLVQRKRLQYRLNRHNMLPRMRPDNLSSSSLPSNPNDRFTNSDPRLGQLTPRQFHVHRLTRRVIRPRLNLPNEPRLTHLNNFHPTQTDTVAVNLSRDYSSEDPVNQGTSRIPTNSITITEAIRRLQGNASNSVFQESEPARTEVPPQSDNNQNSTRRCETERSSNEAPNSLISNTPTHDASSTSSTPASTVSNPDAPSCSNQTETARPTEQPSGPARNSDEWLRSTVRKFVCFSKAPANSNRPSSPPRAPWRRVFHLRRQRSVPPLSTSSQQSPTRRRVFINRPPPFMYYTSTSPAAPSNTTRGPTSRESTAEADGDEGEEVRFDLPVTPQSMLDIDENTMVNPSTIMIITYLLEDLLRQQHNQPEIRFYRLINEASSRSERHVYSHLMSVYSRFTRMGVRLENTSFLDYRIAESATNDQDDIFRGRHILSIILLVLTRYFENQYPSIDPTSRNSVLNDRLSLMLQWCVHLCDTLRLNVMERLPSNMRDTHEYIMSSFRAIHERIDALRERRRNLLNTYQSNRMGNYYIEDLSRMTVNDNPNEIAPPELNNIVPEGPPPPPNLTHVRSRLARRHIDSRRERIDAATREERRSLLSTFRNNTTGNYYIEDLSRMTVNDNPNEIAPIELNNIASEAPAPPSNPHTTRARMVRRHMENMRESMGLRNGRLDHNHPSRNVQNSHAATTSQSQDPVLSRSHVIEHFMARARILRRRVNYDITTRPSVVPLVQVNDVPIGDEPVSNRPVRPMPLPQRVSTGYTFRPRFLHPFYAGSVLVDGDIDDPQREQIFGMDADFPASACANHRIQIWNISDGRIPSITNPDKNVVVADCKIHNDASVDISQDGNLLVTLLPSGGYLNNTNKLGVFSIQWDNLGQCLYTASFEQNVVSVSLSATARYLAVGLASRRVSSLAPGSERCIMAQLYKLETDGRTLLARDIEKSRSLGTTSINCIRWSPVPGQGLVYATNSGHLKVLT